MTDLKSQIRQLPTTPGVYLYRDAKREIIYIGKAVNLKKRVSQYFQRRPLDAKTQALVREIVSVEVIELESELDALFLESELVKRHQPRYNILLRDDKSPIYLKINWLKTVPDVSWCRLPSGDGAEYLGPFYSAQPVRQAMRYLRRVFPYFTKPYRAGHRPNLDWHIGLEPRVETPEQLETYRHNLRQISRLVRGERLAIMRDLERLMTAAAKNQQFEAAAIYRNQLRNLSNLQRRILIREEDSLNRRSDPALRQLQQLLGLKKLPHRIEGFDISHMSGTNVVASMTVFLNGLSARSEYRRFKIKIDQNDDVYNLAETIGRRFKASNVARWGLPDLILIDGGKGQLAAALSVLEELALTIPIIALAEQHEEIIFDLTRSQIKPAVPIQATGQFGIISLPDHDETRKLLERIRDEAHRFAVNYHSQLRRRQQTISQLDQIKGIGPATRQKLIKHFKTLSKVRAASLEDLQQVIGRERARLIYQALQTSDKTD